MSRILLVTQSARAIGEFRRRWVRGLHRRFLDAHRRAAAAAVARLASEGELTLLTARELIDSSSLPVGVTVRYYDEETYRVDSEELADLTRQLAGAWWPPPGPESGLEYRGVWLPELLAMSRGLVLRLEVAEPLGGLDNALSEVKATRVAVMSGASMPERLVRLVAERDGLPCEVVMPRFWASRLHAAAGRALFPREERLRLRQFLDHPRRRPAASPRSMPLLFVTCRPRHHYVVDPLVAAAQAGSLPVHVLATPSDEPEMAQRLGALGRSRATWGYLTDYLPRAEATRLVRRYQPRFRALWRRISTDGIVDRSLVWKGLPLGGPARPFLRDSVERTLVTALLFQEAAFRALDALRPRAVIITSNRRYAERALALAARVRRVPCLHFSGASLLGRERPSLSDISDRMLVIGEHLRERLMNEQGVDPARITVVGDPRSNAARLLSREQLREEIASRFGLERDRPLIVLVSKYVSLLFSAAEKESLYRTVLAAVQRLDRPNVVVKVHPNEDLVLLRRQVRAWGWPDAVLTKDYDIHRLFRAADAAVMVTSMAGVEAMALGCPVVAAQTPGKSFEGKDMPPYVSFGAVARVDLGDAEALASALQRLLTDSEARARLVERGAAFSARYLSAVDGKLTERLLLVIEGVRAEIGEPEWK